MELPGLVDAPAALPRSDGEFEITGRDADGEELFSLSFSMSKVADGDGRSSRGIPGPEDRTR